MPDFLEWHIKNSHKTVVLINEYKMDSAEKTKLLYDLSEEAQIELSPIEEIDAEQRGAPIKSTSVIRTTTTNMRTPQQEFPLLYNLLAFGFGVIFVAAILMITVAIPNPTLFQIRVFTAVLALALAGAATVITGILNVKAKLGTQFVVGAGGALAVFVIVYLVNPAILK